MECGKPLNVGRPVQAEPARYEVQARRTLSGRVRNPEQDEDDALMRCAADRPNGDGDAATAEGLVLERAGRYRPIQPLVLQPVPG